MNVVIKRINAIKIDLKYHIKMTIEITLIEYHLNNQI